MAGGEGSIAPCPLNPPLYVLSQLCVNLGKDKPKLNDIHDHMILNWAPQWRQLGTQLDIDKKLLDIIQHNHPNDCESCCSEMFSEWLNSNPAASWEDIITAVDNLSPDGMCECTY